MYHVEYMHKLYLKTKDNSSLQTGFWRGRKKLASAKQKNSASEGNFTVVCLVTRTISMNTSEAGCDLALIQTSLPFSFIC